LVARSFALCCSSTESSMKSTSCSTRKSGYNEPWTTVMSRILQPLDDYNDYDNTISDYQTACRHANKLIYVATHHNPECYRRHLVIYPREWSFFNQSTFFTPVLPSPEALLVPFASVLSCPFIIPRPNPLFVAAGVGGK
jgi:hypothetical protein